MSERLALPKAVFEVERASERGSYDHGWLRTSHSFSFAEYHDERYVNWGALRVFNDDRVAPGKGFGTHPHRDMEILTYVLSGQLEHRDSLGSHGVVGPGGVQFMSAGTGIRHSELNHSATEELHFLQMWVLPGRLGGEPLYGEAAFDVAARRGRWLRIASGRPGDDAPVRLTQDATFQAARIEGGRLQYDFDPGRYGFVFVADGTIEVAGAAPTFPPAVLTAGDAVRIAGLSRLTLEGAGEVVLWDVPPLPAAP